MIVTGDDNFAIEFSRRKYLDRIKACHGEYKAEMFDALNERIDEFMAKAMTASLFQEIRVYCVLHAQSFTEKDLAALDKALDYEIPDVYIFISAEFDSNDAAKKKSGEAKIAKALRLKKREDDKSVSIKDCSKQPDYKIPEWIVEQVPLMFDRYIGMDEAEFLARTVEYDLLYSELQKIDLALEPGARIDKKIIQEIVGATRTMTVYNFSSALCQRDLPAALEVLDSLFANNTVFPTPFAVSAVFRDFWAMLKIRKFLKKNPHILKQFNTRGYGKDSPQTMAAVEIGIAAGLLTFNPKGRVFPVIIKSGIVQHAQSFSERGLREVIRMLQQFDVGVKKFRIEPNRCNLQMLCYRIARAA